MITIKKYFQDTNLVFISRWRTTSNASVTIGVVLAIYGINFFLRNTTPSPIWMLWWALCSSYSAAFGVVAYRHYAEYKENQLAMALANPSGMNWVIYTSDNIKIGEIEECNYLKAKHEADSCWFTKILQVLNCFWVVWCTASNLLAALPLIITLLFVGSAITMPQEDLSALTIGQIMTAIADSWPMLINFFVLYVFLVFAVYGAIGKSVPGYKSYYGLRLKRLLSRHVPNIAHADGYKIAISAKGR